MRKRLTTILAAACALCLAALPYATVARAQGVVPDEYEIADFAGESDFSVYIDAEGTLYTAGDNGGAALGRGTAESATKIEPLTVAVLENVRTADTGRSGFVLAVTDDGRLYAWGSNEYGQAGGDVTAVTTGNTVPTPTEGNMPAGSAAIADVQAGARHSLVLTEDGSVYAFGHNSLGQLGLSMAAERQSLTSVPTRIDPAAFGSEPVVQIAACEYTSFALTESGAVYGWGDDLDKLLMGLGGDEELCTAPVKLPLNGIRKLSAESTTAMALSTENRVYVWGNNTFGQFGRPDVTETSGGPYEIEALYTQDGTPVEAGISDIVCGGVSNFILSDDGRVFGFGKAGSGELGFSPRTSPSPYVVAQNRATAPTELLFYQPVAVEASAGETAPVDRTRPIDVTIVRFAGSIGTRTFALDDAGQMWAWGDNANGLVCSGNIASLDTPVRATLYRIDNYDKEIIEKDYTRQPIIGLSIIGGLAVLFLAWAEIKRARIRKLAAREEQAGAQAGGIQ